MRIHALEHVPFERPAAIGEWAATRGHSLAATRLYEGDPLPDLASIELLVVMGGPMSVHDEARYDWLRAEKRLLRRAVERETPVLGVCLGAQLVAEALGAAVRPNGQREIGWFPLRLRDEARRSPLFRAFPSSFPAFHWHGETFDLPADALPVAESDGCANQGFVFGERIVGLQFHLEATEGSIAGLVENCANELIEGSFVQPLQEGRLTSAPSDLETAHALLAKLLDGLVARG